MRFREFLNHRKIIQAKRELQKNEFRKQRYELNELYNIVGGYAQFCEIIKESEDEYENL